MGAVTDTYSRVMRRPRGTTTTPGTGIAPVDTNDAMLKELARQRTSRMLRASTGRQGTFSQQPLGAKTYTGG